MWHGLILLMTSLTIVVLIASLSSDGQPQVKKTQESDIYIQDPVHCSTPSPVLLSI